MNKKIWVRILTALSGVLLVCAAMMALAETFFHAPVTGAVSRLLNARTPGAVLLTLLLALAVGAMGVACVLSLIPPRKNKTRGFVMQKGENGAIGVSVRSIEGLVQTCVQQYNVVSRAEVSVLEKRDGIVILLNIEETAGVNIPLSVGALQKQIRQYVNACTGVEVQEVRVLVENTENGVEDTPYAVQGPAMLTTAVTAAELYHEEAPAEQEEPVAPVTEVPAEEAEQIPEIIDEVPAVDEAATPAFEEEPAQVEEIVEEPVPVQAAVPVMIPELPEIIEEEDDRPLHQRLFGAEEQPVFVPAPPELVVEPEEEEPVEAYAEAEDQEAAEDTAQTDVPSDQLDEDAVTEVAYAMAMAEAEPEEVCECGGIQDEAARVEEAEIQPQDVTADVADMTDEELPCQPLAEEADTVGGDEELSAEQEEPDQQ